MLLLDRALAVGVVMLRLGLFSACCTLQDELVLDTGVAKLADFGLSKTIASLAPKLHQDESAPRDSEGVPPLGVEASAGSLVSAATRGSHGSKHKIVQLVSPSCKGTVESVSYTHLTLPTICSV